MSRKSQDCIICGHPKNEHIFDEKEDYGYCLKCTCNRYRDN